jgi:ligand-binding sensor domain-containing protein
MEKTRLPRHLAQSKIRLVRWLFLLLPLGVAAQSTSYNFRHLTSANGLSNSTIRAIARDKYGFVWIATVNGLNRFDGHAVKTYLKSDKPGGIPSLAVTSLYADEEGTLWVGTRTALCYYQYETDRFVPCRSASIVVNDITPADTAHLWIAANDGAYLLDKKSKELVVVERKELSGVRMTRAVQSGGTVYFSSGDGLYAYDRRTNKYGHFYFPGVGADSSIQAIAAGSNGTLWLSIGFQQNRVVKYNALTKTTELLPLMPSLSRGFSGNIVNHIAVDKKGFVWLSTSAKGLVRYDPSSGKYLFFSTNNALPNGISSDNIRCVFLDSEGGIWLGTEGYGVDWFYPDKNLFNNIQSISSKEEALPGNWCRAATEDSSGNLWLGLGTGLSCYNPAIGSFKNYLNLADKKNILYSNSIRSLLTDQKGNVWIGTGSGLNRYSTATKQFEFLDEKNGIGKIFVWSLYLDRNGTVWAGGNSGVYRWDETKKKFDDFSTEPLLAGFSNRVFRTIFQDSKGRYWFSIGGVLLYDPEKGTVKQYAAGTSGLGDETVNSITEDNDGLIWFGTMNGLTSLQVETNKIVTYRRTEGLPSNETESLLVDPLGRLWFGTANGLCFFDKRTSSFTSFDMNDGLCYNQFNEQSAYRMRNGHFVYPTYKGFVLFDPLRFKAEKARLDVFATNFKVLGKDKRPTANPEELKQVDLAYDQNFFTIELASPYYPNADHVWYAYLLDGFDKEWHYTHDRLVSYTNVPGGDYVFRYKAGTDPAHWLAAEKTITLHIGTVYYKTIWFWVLLAVVTIGAIAWIYSLRKRKKEELLRLEAKAQRLEKEKALVQYESLKQQVNPHFLFNSLTSLRSLIRIDRQQAAEFLDKMSLTYRYILKSSERELVPLKEELQFAQTYIDLQKTRFQKGVQVNVNVNEYHSEKKIVPVTLQNLLENAIKHNRTDEEEPLVIEVFTRDDYLVVQNNVLDKGFVATSNKQGLQNMIALYKYLDKRAIEITSADTYFTVKIPLL